MREGGSDVAKRKEKLLCSFTFPLKVAHVYEMVNFLSIMRSVWHEDPAQKLHRSQQELPLIQNDYWPHSMKKRVSSHFCEF